MTADPKITNFTRWLAMLGGFLELGISIALIVGVGLIAGVFIAIGRTWRKALMAR